MSIDSNHPSSLCSISPLLLSLECPFNPQTKRASSSLHGERKGRIKSQCTEAMPTASLSDVFIYAAVLLNGHTGMTPWSAANPHNNRSEGLLLCSHQRFTDQQKETICSSGLLPLKREGLNMAGSILRVFQTYRESMGTEYLTGP